MFHNLQSAIFTSLFSGSVASLESCRSSFSSLAAIDNGASKLSRSATPTAPNQQAQKSGEK